MSNFGLPALLLILVGLFSFESSQKLSDRKDDSKILFFEINPKEQELAFYWKNKTGQPYKNFNALNSSLKEENKDLIFAMNGGMYKANLSPQGLYIENGRVMTAIDTINQGYGNFYMQPNGIFYLTNENKPVICTTNSFESYDNIKYATQSGPMLLIEGETHPTFREGSTHLNIRNGVGILENGNLLFAMSQEKINFHDFADYFKRKGCKNALYLDGFVSRTYLPSKNWVQLDGNFGVIIGVTEPDRK